MSTSIDTVYRYKEQRYASLYDEFNQSYYRGEVTLRCLEFRVLKRTHCGVWIDEYGTRRFVNLNARRKFASASKADALLSFIARKNRQISILSAQRADAEDACAKAKIALAAL